MLRIGIVRTGEDAEESDGEECHALPWKCSSDANESAASLYRNKEAGLLQRTSADC
jgi:hypothetical protein